MLLFIYWQFLRIRYQTSQAVRLAFYSLRVALDGALLGMGEVDAVHDMVVIVGCAIGVYLCGLVVCVWVFIACWVLMFWCLVGRSEYVLPRSHWQAVRKTEIRAWKPG